MLTWETVDEWYGQVARAVHSAAQGFDGKSVGVARSLVAQERMPDLNERTFLNNLTPTTDSHQLKLEELWHVLDVTGREHSVHVLARQMHQLVAPIPDPQSVSSSALFGAFSERKREIVETQQLVHAVLNGNPGFSSRGARESLLREVYEDFCESIGILLQLQTLIPGLENPESGLREDSYGKRFCYCMGGIADFLGSNEELLLKDGIRVGSAKGQGDSNAPAKRLSLKRFLQVLDWDTSGTVLEFFLTSLGYQSYPLPPLVWESYGPDLLAAYADMENRQADTVSRIHSAMEDGVITPAELKSIRDELEEEYQAEVSLLMSLPVVSAV